MPEVVCPTCRKKLRPPDRLAGKRVTCPRCEAVLTVPLPSDSSEDIPTDIPAPETAPEDPPLPSSARIGIVALALGCVSVLIMCLPFINYASIVLSGIGLPMGLWGLLRARMEGNEMLCRSLTGGAGIIGSFGMHARDYPLAGIAACLLALALSLLPILMH
jgi:hypothetical protein